MITNIKHINDLKNISNNTTISIYGFICKIRCHGKVNFIVLQSNHEELQCVITNKLEIEKIHRWCYIKATGCIKHRKDNYINIKQKFGNIELLIQSIEIINRQDDNNIDVYNITTDSNLYNKYRYLYLRNKCVFNKLQLRHNVITDIRNIMNEMNFIEICTPIISCTTPEGASDYIVLSQKNIGKVYALPQSPQIYKQILMVSDVARYFQIAPCFRDEEARVNRLPTDFYQLDIEIQPAIEKSDVMNMVDNILNAILEKYAYTKIIKKYVYTHKEIMEKYGYDSIDMRIVEEYKYKFNNKLNTFNIKNKDNIYGKICKVDKNITLTGGVITVDITHSKISETMSIISSNCKCDFISYVWVTDFPKYTKNYLGETTFMHNPFAKSVYNKDGISTTEQYDIIINGEEIGGGSIRETCHKKLIKTFIDIGYTEEEARREFPIIDIFKNYSTPQHGGIAIGIERLLGLIENNKYAKEYIAFPFLQNAVDNMLNSPRKITDKDILKYGFKNNNNA